MGLSISSSARQLTKKKTRADIDVNFFFPRFHRADTIRQMFLAAALDPCQWLS